MGLRRGDMMKKLTPGTKYQIQCYKHNGKIHRAWDEAVLLDIKPDYMVFGNNKTLVTEAVGNTWKTKEPAIMYFFKEEWFNVIVQFKKDGIYYYCNIATPFIIEEDTIKYIDYDLDLRVFPNGSYKILDRMEYKYHKKMMDYSSDLDRAINYALDDLIKKYRNHHFAFDSVRNKKYLEQYRKLKNN